MLLATRFDLRYLPSSCKGTPSVYCTEAVQLGSVTRIRSGSTPGIPEFVFFSFGPFFFRLCFPDVFEEEASGPGDCALSALSALSVSLFVVDVAATLFIVSVSA